MKDCVEFGTKFHLVDVQVRESIGLVKFSSNAQV
jgi:hypothetical protein